jgi:hypothetical protein
MILTLQIPRHGKPSCWFAFNEDDFIRKVQAARQAAPGVIFSAGTPRELLSAQGWAADSAASGEQHAGLVQLAEVHGWDTRLYRADYLLAPGHYQVEEVSEFVAHVAATAQDLRTCRVYRDEEQAMDALYSDALYAGPEGFYAHMALREQLIALEVISDDL